MGALFAATTPFALSLSFDKLRMIGGFDKLSPSGALGNVLQRTNPFALSLSFDKLRMIGGFDKLSPSGAWGNVLQRTNPFALSPSKRCARAGTEIGGART